MTQTTRSRKATSPSQPKTAAAPRGKKAGDDAPSAEKGAPTTAAKTAAKSAVPRKPAPKSKTRTTAEDATEAKPSAKPSGAKPAKPAKGKAAGKGASKSPHDGASKASPKPAAAKPAVEAGPAYEVRRSAIHGLGLFATRRIRADERIGVYQGPRSRKIDTYVLWVEDENGKEYGIDGKNEMRYVNHSQDPNAAFEGEELWSLRRIEPGEEITHHYGEDWED